MHVPPIDILTGTLEPQKAAPTESEPDSRFSDLLRGPSDAEATRPDTATAPKSKPAAPADETAQTEIGTDASVETGYQATVAPDAEPSAPEVPGADKAVIATPTVFPEAITWTQPQVGTGAEAGTVAVDTAAVGQSVLPTVAPSAQAPVPAVPTVAPSQTPAAANGPEALVPAMAGPTAGTPSAPQGQPQAHPTIPVTGSGPSGPADPGHPGKVGGAQPAPSPTAPTQPVMAAAAPVAAAGKAIAGANAPEEAPRPSTAAPASTATASSADGEPVLRPASGPASVPTPERSASAQTSAPAAGELPPPKETPALPAPPAQRVAPDAQQAAAVRPGPKIVAASATASPAIDKPATAPTTTVPSTVAETVDAAAPQAGQSDPLVTTSAGPSGRAAATAGSPTALAHTPTAAQPAAEQVVLQVQRAARDGIDRLTMQLKPASLGRVDVQMEVGFDGRLQAVISAERPETLHLLQRDARALTEALNNAGLQTDSGSLSFNLREQSGDPGGGNGNEPAGPATSAHDHAADELDAATTEITLTLGDGRVDIKV